MGDGANHDRLAQGVASTDGFGACFRPVGMVSWAPECPQSLKTGHVFCIAANGSCVP